MTIIQTPLVEIVLRLRTVGRGGEQLAVELWIDGRHRPDNDLAVIDRPKGGFRARRNTVDWEDDHSVQMAFGDRVLDVRKKEDEE